VGNIALRAQAPRALHTRVCHRRKRASRGWIGAHASMCTQGLHTRARSTQKHMQACVLYFGACLGHLSQANGITCCVLQMARVIGPFLGQPSICKSASLKHKVLMARQRSSRASGRWSRLAEGCTQAHGVPSLQVLRCASSRTPHV